MSEESEFHPRSEIIPTYLTKNSMLGMAPDTTAVTSIARLFKDDGFGVGIVDRDKVITGENIKAGDVLIGLPSTGVHSNGFSLVRKIVLERQNMKLDQYVDELGMTIGECLLTPTRLYPRPCLPIIKNFTVEFQSTHP